jgi:hypothetical protein
MAMKKRLLAIFLLSSATTAFANGSSGVGSAKIPITDGISAALPSNFARTQGDKILDGSETLFALSPIKRSELSEKWVSARLGSVQGYEYWPTPDSNESNAWVICEKTKDTCTKLVPLSKSNHKIPAIIGSLIRDK